MLAAPWALLGLLSLPVVFGIYFFRTRSRRRDVSALFLWVDRRQAAQGGRQFQTLQLPLLLFLELLALLLLSVAAARPMFRIESAQRPTAVILDSSYSMQAGLNGNTAQQRAVDHLAKMLRTQTGYPVQFITAGVKPQLFGNRAKNAAEAEEVLKNWQCTEPTADLDAAVSFARNVSLPGTKILVVSDHFWKAGFTETGSLLWKSYGEALPNFAVVNSSRVFRNEKDKMLLEIANFSETAQQLQLTVLEPEKQRVVYRFNESAPLLPNEVKTLRMDVPAGTGVLEVRLGSDVLEFDNRLTLPPPPPPARVQLGELPDGLGEKIKRAVEASGIAVIVNERPDIVFGTVVNGQETVFPGCTVKFYSESDTEKVKPYIGPFILDRSNPLTEGLTLDGVVWSAFNGGKPVISASPVISAGDVPLLTDSKKQLTFYLNSKVSTLTEHPAFPVLIYNILKRNQESVSRKDLSRENGQPVISAEESNLLSAITATDGNWYDDETLRTEYQPVAYLLLLATLGVLTVHLYAMRR
ncbi:MAG: BatA and WFA domain-containing protein [Planctomycetaceae bacterium]|jgi:hypothetical protein|nr:BatA and WFA domain-containing protein [Planctomycetaceae bacterium]